MDPEAIVQPGQALLLMPTRPSTPFAALRGTAALAAVRQAPGPKPLRPPKEKQPVAARLDQRQVLKARPARLSTLPSVTAAPAHGATVATFPGGQDSGASIPPDTAGAVGPQHVFNPLNDTVSIFDRSGTPLSAITLNGFWAALGLPGETFDPRVVYDAEGRFVFVAMADAMQATSSLFVAVSETSDPMGAWIPAAIQVDDQAQGPVWLDFPSVGYSADKVTVQVNLFTRAGNRFAGSSIYVFDKRSLYDPPHGAAVERFDLRNQGGTQVPALTHDRTTNDQYLLARWSGIANGGGALVVYRVTGNVAAGTAALSRVGYVAAPGVTWDSFPPGDMGPQIGVPQKVDVGDDRLLAVCLRDGLLYCSHTVMLPTGAPSRSAVQWWQIDTRSWTVNILERIDDLQGATLFAFPTLAVNQRNEVLLGFAYFAGSAHPSAALAFRPAMGPTQPPHIFAAGLDTYYKVFTGSDNRWGDYSAAQVDPVNDLDFWTVQEYAATPADTWGTMWAHIVPPPTAGGP